ncbi:MAG: lactonase family protein [Planctomycetota bacterium]|nr:lactonase family protein [Planctomycetota bacterium]
MPQINRSVAAVLGVSLAIVTSLVSDAAAQDAAPGAGDDGGLIVFIGTSSSPKSQGIYLTRMDPKTGALSTPQLAVEAKSPNFLAFHPNNKFLYACAELTDAAGAKSGGVGAFSIDAKTGKLTALNQQPSGGRGPCYVAVDKTGRNVLVANYGSGGVACLPIGDDGTLREPSSVIQHEGGSKVVKKRQDGPHAHWINTDASNRFVLAADLGLDKVMLYQFDPAKGTLTPNDPPAGITPPGAGPRHIAWHPSQKIVYVINELGNTVTAFHFDPERGAMTEFQTVPSLPADFKDKNNTTAEVVVHPNGKFLYGSNRGHDSIALFAIGADGKLTPRGHTSTQGEVPRNFVIDPSGQFLLAANQKTDTVVVFKINQETGELTPTGSKIEVGAPVCLRFLPSR